MKIFIALSALVAACAAFVCPPDACANIEKPVLNCLGDTIVGSGWCGCTDSCARLEGEECSIGTFSIPNERQCGKDLVCKPVNLEGVFGKHICINKSLAETFVSKRMVCLNACDNVDQGELNCVGGMHNTDYCGCRKACNKQKGESCTLGTGLSGLLLGVPFTGEKCEEGLVCKDLNLEGHSTPTCVDPAEDTDDVLRSKRSDFMVCPPNACDNVVKEDLNCKGGLIKNAGWCGCTDHCAKVRGERCAVSTPTTLLLGVISEDNCDDGLVCHKAFEGSAICLMPNETSTFVSKRSMACDTPCRRKSQACTFSFVIYEGQWFARCDSDGNFLREQCNNKKECFCVDENGTIDESTRVLGSVNCY